MSTLKFEKRIIPSASFNGFSSLPPIAINSETESTSDEFFLEEDDGLYLGYGRVPYSYPYRYQDMYSRELTDTEYTFATLENEHLRATFLPAMGGKLWSLYDKDAEKELLFENDVIRPCNLAVRNAWTSGGIEWNVGFKGHYPYTCSLINTARTHLEDGTPVLRFYYFERVREVVVQMDFFIPEGEKFLYARMRITNPNGEVVPMYWWSNVAVVEHKTDRVIVPATKSYTSRMGDVIKVDIPVHSGINVTYPANNVIANDFFWTTEKKTRKYIAQLDKDGYGLVQTSTDRLKGRKLFMWGNSTGGARWQSWLTSDDKSGSYDEIQCGLANTQYECLPMPPHTTWEWLEAYGAMSADPKRVHGEWMDARAEVEGKLDAMITDDRIEEMLGETRKMAKAPADEIVYLVDGWAALENKMRKDTPTRLMCDHLEFGEPGDEQAAWVSLLEKGTVGKHDVREVPASYQIRKGWIELLSGALEGKDKDNWYAHYLYGTACLAELRADEGEKHLLRSIELEDSAWARYALAIKYQKSGEKAKEHEFIMRAYELCPSDISLAKEVMRSLYEGSHFDVAVSVYESASDAVKENTRCKLYYAYALLKTGRLDEAEAVVCKDGKYLMVADLREGEELLTELWFASQRAKLGEDADIGQPPFEIDFRMFARSDEWKK